MPSRRDALTATGVTALAATAGCLDLILGEDLEYEASAATVSDAALDETGYEEQEVTDFTVDETFEAGGESRDVTVTNWQSEYDKEIEVSGLGTGLESSGRAAVFVAITSPQVEVLGQEFNPIADTDSDDIAEMLEDRYDGLDDLESTGAEDVSVLGESATATRYEGEVEVSALGGEAEMVFFVTETVQTGGDHAFVICGFPEHVEDDERPNFDDLLDGLEHGD